VGIASDILQEYQPKDFPSRLYHYTSTAGLLGILESHSLWFTDTKFLNDGSEIMWGVRIVKDVALALSGTLSDPRDKELVDRVIQRLEAISMPNRAAVFCLCEGENLLNQWRDYGRDVVSYSLGFDPGRLHQAQRYNFSPVLIRVVYDQAAQFQIAQRVVAGVYAMAEGLPVETRDDPDEVAFLVDAAAHELSLVTYYFKNSAFAAEQEWRLLLEAGMIQVLGTAPSFRSSRVGVTPYFTWKPYDADVRLPITSAMVGPCPWPDAALAGLEMLLTERGYRDVRLDASTIPIR
jgi:hypothetical protein